MNIKWIGAHSNNFTKGRQGKVISGIVLHWIVGTLESADATFNKSDRSASAHYGIGEDDIHQYVKEEDTAWHAGDWDTNLRTIGIEHEGGWEIDGGRFKPTQKTHETSAKLVADICKRYNIPIDKDHIIGHKDVSATQCPGTLDIGLIIQLAKGQQMSLKDTIIDFDDDEGKRHNVGWYVYEHALEKKKRVELESGIRDILEKL